MLFGGLPAARARAAEAVRAYADPVIQTGELGTALSVKLVNNFLFAANTQVLAEAIRLGEELGVAPGEMLSALNHMSGGSQVSRRAADGADMASFAVRIGPFMKKDVAVCLEQAAERGVDPGCSSRSSAAAASTSSDLHRHRSVAADRVRYRVVTRPVPSAACPAGRRHGRRPRGGRWRRSRARSARSRDSR